MGLTEGRRRPSPPGTLLPVPTLSAPRGGVRASTLLALHGREMLKKGTGWVPDLGPPRRGTHLSLCPEPTFGTRLLKVDIEFT